VRRVNLEAMDSTTNIFALGASDQEYIMIARRLPRAFATWIELNCRWRRPLAFARAIS
jgi:hypothetical protein